MHIFYSFVPLVSSIEFSRQALLGFLVKLGLSPETEAG